MSLQVCIEEWDIGAAVFVGSAASACTVVLSLAAMVDSVTHGRERVARRPGTSASFDLWVVWVVSFRCVWVPWCGRPNLNHCSFALGASRKI